MPIKPRHGRIGIAIEGKNAVIIELLAQTNATKESKEFVKATNQIATLALPSKATDNIEIVLDNLCLSTGEKISIGRIEKLEGGVFGQYVHSNGETGVLVQASGEASDEVMKQIAMHITATFPPPLWLTANDIPNDLTTKERDFYTQTVIQAAKKSEHISQQAIDKIMQNLHSQTALLEQPFIMDPSKKIKELLGGDTTLTAFHRMQIGE